jgi:transposase
MDWTPKMRHFSSYTLGGKGTASEAKEEDQQDPIGFRKLALERMKTCRNVSELSAELGIDRTQLYKWRKAMEATDDGFGPPANSQERELRKEIRELRRVLGEKVLEADFFKGALQKVEARRQNSGGSGGTGSSSTSGS